MPTSKAECPECGAKPGKPCLSTRGKTVGQPIAGGKLHPKRVMSPVETPQEEETATFPDSPWFGEGLRQRRIDAVITGIRLARKVGATQDQIDRSVAEMIVDAELDATLF